MQTIAPQTTAPVVGVALPEPLREQLRAVAGPDTAWWAADSVADARAALTSAEPTVAPAVVLVSYDWREAWSVLTLLSRLFALPGGVTSRALLVTEAPRSSLPVCLADEPRLDVVAPDAAQTALRTLLDRSS
ncbi:MULTISPECIES: hypothetical protein [unclassified Geodermatophilus]|uniref:hypothetical protein n=1 Tax=unclassified Geodermatophilus TaxID=2637632 RepID=UPI003EEE7681